MGRVIGGLVTRLSLLFTRRPTLSRIGSRTGWTATLSALELSDLACDGMRRRRLLGRPSRHEGTPKRPSAGISRAWNAIWGFITQGPCYGAAVRTRNAT